MNKVVVMGVAGSGKSVLAEQLARHLGCPMVEGDDFHLAGSQDKMRAGIPLDDADREPWLDRLGALLAIGSGDLVLACSALKRKYRERLRSHVPGLRFVYIEIDVQTAARRVAARTAHLFPTSLVTSQFAALESPVGEEGVFEVSALQDTEVQVGAVAYWLAGDAPTPALPRKGREQRQGV
ncbi:MAG TPA: gluconokinase, GntK/IdnK-type [Ramlibacter sp.]|uniref:gluconokinase n=1 Tax=Ramlibacter sp. TaxID=1917967 RepID=UPI002ED46E16